MISSQYGSSSLSQQVLNIYMFEPPCHYKRCLLLLPCITHSCIASAMVQYNNVHAVVVVTRQAQSGKLQVSLVPSHPHCGN